MTSSTFYFDEASSKHTDQVFSIVKQYLERNPEIEHVVVATTQGETGLAASKFFCDKHLVVVSHQSGFKTPNMNELSTEARLEIEKNGAKVHTATHVFAGVSRSFRRKVNTWTPTEMMAIAFRTFGQGTKVCAEIAMMAADAGLVPVNRDVICIAGTGRGADTAWVIQPANSHDFPEIRMRICLCKPRSF